VTRLALLLAGLAVVVLPLAAQEPTPRFEVASIKLNRGAIPIFRCKHQA